MTSADVAGEPEGGGTPTARPAAADVAWMTGFECSAFPQVGMDELALTQHDRFWGSDLVRAVEAGCGTIRYGIRWHVVNPQLHVWDWWRRYATASPETTVGPLARSSTNAGIPLW